MGNQPI